MRIGNNISAMNTLNRLTVNNSQLSKSLEKLSSGSAINRAADDAAGLAISEKMRAQIAGLEQASKNAQDGISLVQTAEGALDQTHTALRRMETLAMKATNGTITAEDRAKIQAEVDQRTEEIDRVAETSNFNGIKLFDGSLGGGVGDAKMAANDTAAATALEHGGISFTGGTDGVEITFVTDDATEKADSAAAWSGNTLTITLGIDDGTGTGEITTYSQDEIQALIDNATGTVPTGVDLKISVGGDGNVTTAATAGNIADTAKFEDFITASAADTVGGAALTVTSDGGKLANNATITFANPTAAEATAAWDTNGDLTITLDSRKTSYSEAEINALIKNATGTKPEAAEGLKVSLDKSISTTGLADEITANGGNTVLTLDGGQGTKSGGMELQIGASADAADKISVSIDKMDSASLLGSTTLDMSTPDAANAAMTKISAAIEKVSEQRASLGAVQNRLEQTIENLSTTAENMSAAESRIRDVDMAKEMTNFTKFSILSQASQAMLAQANALPQGVLQLLG